MAGDSMTDPVIVDVISVALQGPQGATGPQGPQGLPGSLGGTGGGTMTGPLYVTATGTPATRSVQDHFAEVVNVKDWGAVGDGATDDAAAINAAMAYIRTQLAALPAPLAPYGGFRLVFPYGVYVVRHSLNLTNLQPWNGVGVIDGQGSIILGKIAGAPVIDAMGSRWLHFQDIGIYGDQTTRPSIGIQLGRSADWVSADYHVFKSVHINGYFTFTAFYNLASESMGCYSCEFRNSTTGLNAFCMVQDGINHWNITSAFVTVTTPVEALQSFIGDLFNTCTWQGNGDNGVIWQSNTAEHKYVDCYASCQATSGASTITIYTVYQPHYGGPAATQLDIHCHCETTALKHAFLMTGPAGQTFGFITEFSFQDHGCQAATSVFAIDAGSALTLFSLRNVELRLGIPGGAPLFDVPSKWQVSARYAGITGGLGATLPALWNGPVSNYNNDVTYNALYNWTSGTRPSPVPRGTIGFASDTTRFEVYDGSVWRNHVRLDGDTMTGTLVAPTLGGSTAVVSGTVAGTVSQVVLTAAVGNARTVQFRSDTRNRWQIETTSTGEGGGNAGSDFAIDRFTDAGAYVDSPLTIARSTGAITLAQALRMTGLQASATYANDAAAAAGGVPLGGIYRNGSAVMVRVA